MIKIESATLEGAYQDAASSLECSVTQLKIEVVQYPNSGFLGLFKKNAIIVAVIDADLDSEFKKQEESREVKVKEKPKAKTFSKPQKQKKQDKPAVKTEVKKEKKESHTILNDTIMPQSFVSTQEEEDEEDDVASYLADYDDEFDNLDGEDLKSTAEIAKVVQADINKLFSSICFEIEKIDVSVYDENTLLIEFKGEDAALLIGKEESVSRYLSGVKESVDRDGRAQTKVLDGVLVQIALRELREIYPDKYVAIRSTRDGLKYIIINDYHSN
jgi:spoIIIJ-associated protein